jgi:hypothetical protein
MTEVRRHTTASVQDVFAVLQDGWLYASWVVGASRARNVDPRWPAPGARLHHSVGLWPVLLDDVTEVLAVEPPHRMVLRAKGRPLGEAMVDIRLLPARSGCTILISEDVSRGAGRYLPRRLRDTLLGWRNRETLRRLALIAEGTARVPDPSPESRATVDQGDDQAPDRP